MLLYSAHPESKGAVSTVRNEGSVLVLVVPCAPCGTLVVLPSFSVFLPMIYRTYGIQRTAFGNTASLLFGPSSSFASSESELGSPRSRRAFPHRMQATQPQPCLIYRSCHTHTACTVPYIESVLHFTGSLLLRIGVFIRSNMRVFVRIGIGITIASHRIPYRARYGTVYARS